MVERLINRKDAVNEVLSDKKCDMLLFVSELQSLEEMVELLKYFAVQTGNLLVVVIWASCTNGISFICSALVHQQQ